MLYYSYDICINLFFLFIFFSSITGDFEITIKFIGQLIFYTIFSDIFGWGGEGTPNSPLT
jgi:hypothetical protein